VRALALFSAYMLKMAFRKLTNARVESPLGVSLLVRELNLKPPTAEKKEL
jgi:hypothetical protein